MKNMLTSKVEKYKNIY